MIDQYRRRFAEGRTYSLPAYLLGATLHHRFDRAGAVAWLRGLPRPAVHAVDGTIEVGDVALYPGVRLSAVAGGRISIGDGTYLNRNTLVHAERAVTIGRDAMIAWDVVITDTPGFGDRPGTGEARPVTIGDRAWIGAKAVILAGASIGEGAVVAAGAVVSGPVPPGAIVAGQGARAVRTLRSPEHV